MLKNYIGIYGNLNSGIKSKEEVQAWCGARLAEGLSKAANTKAWVCKVTTEVRLVTPAIEVVPFDAGQFEVAKAA